MPSGVYERKLRPVKERLMGRIEMIPDAGCWIWLGHVTHKGYGQIGVGRKVELTHRVAYREFKGEIPDGTVIDHKCNNPSCVNPSHLEAVTNGENISRAYKRDGKVHWRKKCTNIE